MFVLYTHIISHEHWILRGICFRTIDVCLWWPVTLRVFFMYFLVFASFTAGASGAKSLLKLFTIHLSWLTFCELVALSLFLSVTGVILYSSYICLNSSTPFVPLQRWITERGPAVEEGTTGHKAKERRNFKTCSRWSQGGYVSRFYSPAFTAGCVFLLLIIL